MRLPASRQPRPRMLDGLDARERDAGLRREVPGQAGRERFDVIDRILPARTRRPCSSSCRSPGRTCCRRRRKPARTRLRARCSIVRSTISCGPAARRTLTSRTLDLPYRFQVSMVDACRCSAGLQACPPVTSPVRRIPVRAEQQRNVMVLPVRARRTSPATSGKNGRMSWRGDTRPCRTSAGRSRRRAARPRSCRSGRDRPSFAGRSSLQPAPSRASSMTATPEAGTPRAMSRTCVLIMRHELPQPQRRDLALLLGRHGQFRRRIVRQPRLEQRQHVPADLPVAHTIKI